jgi:uncharacterized protein (DUF433 family)
MQKQKLNQPFAIQPARGSGAAVIAGMARTAPAAVLANSPASRMYGKAEKAGRK